MQAFRWIRSWLVVSLLAVATAAVATTDITNRDLQALSGVKAVVLADPQLDEDAVAAGITAAQVERRTRVYFREIGVQVLSEADGASSSAERAQAPTLLIQIGVRKEERQRASTYITLNLLRATAEETRPVYVVQHVGHTRQRPTRNFLMRELDLALNMLREDLRRGR